MVPSFTIPQWLRRPRVELSSEMVPLLLGEDPTKSDPIGDQYSTPALCSWWSKACRNGDDERRRWLELLDRDIEDGLLPIELERGVNSGALIQHIAYGGEKPSPNGVSARWIVPRTAIAWAVRNRMALPNDLRTEAEILWPELLAPPVRETSDGADHQEKDLVARHGFSLRTIQRALEPAGVDAENTATVRARSSRRS